MQVLTSTYPETVTASPVRGPITVDHTDSGEFTASWVINPDDPIFHGHYPGFRIYPGVCVIESAHQVALAIFAAEDRSVVLTSIERTRFRKPVFPGDRIIVSGTATELADGSGLRCVARVQSVRGAAAPSEVARIRLLFGWGAR